MEKKEEITSRKNAYCLKICGIIQLILCIVASVFTFYNYSIIFNQVNWIGVGIGLGIALLGFTIFFLINTIVDVYIEIIADK